MNNKYFNFWAKTSNEDDQWHTLLWHMVDTGLVARALWEHALSRSFKLDIAETLALNEGQARDMVSFWISLHDIGKAGPAFQRKSEARMKQLKNIGFIFPNMPEKFPGYHGHATAWILETYWKEKFPEHKRFANVLALTLGGHHGEFPENAEDYRDYHLGDKDWESARIDLIDQLIEIFSPPITFSPPRSNEKLNSLLFMLAGLTTTADWIASNSDYFPYNDGTTPLETYLQESMQRANHALHDLEWTGWKASGKPISFSQMFPEFIPNNLQQTLINETPQLTPPFLLILEAPTGSGKTEAALYLADNQIQKENKSGFFIAMPTQATSNQIFNRTLDLLDRRYPNDRLNVQLVHGAALINDTFKKIQFDDIAQDEPGTWHNISSAEWFIPHKKSLLAPFGVGTVDQTFLSVMRCKHFFLRLFGLSHKILIFDEVHAYDVYMLEIFKRLLTWLRAVNTSVIILSATLPTQSRRELLQAYAGKEESDTLSRVSFPRLSVSDKNGMRIKYLGDTDSRSIPLQWLQEDDLSAMLQQKLIDGGNAAVICNRVDHVIEIYDRLVEIFPPDELTVFHSRFPFCLREKIENKVKEHYGKASRSRPKRSIVIATQVIEQSLDLDFDLMVSPIAPVDLLIQRVGRLHRHTGSKYPPKRPPPLTDPQLILLEPKSGDMLPDFGKDTYIYEQYLLQRTWFCLDGRTELTLPAQTDELIEFVYSDQPAPGIPDEAWPQLQALYKKMTHAGDKDALKADSQLLQRPSQRILGKLQAGFRDEHDPSSLSIMHTLTRNAPPSAQVACLRQTETGLFPLDEDIPIDLNTVANYEVLRACRRSTLTLTRKDLVSYFFAQQMPAGWEKTAGLRTIYPLIFKDSICRVNGKTLLLDPIRGLCLLKDK